MQENKYAEMILKLEEGFRQHEYYCTEQYRTIGYGQKLSNIKNDPLTNQTVTEKDALQFLRKRIDQHIRELSVKYNKAWNNCNMAQQAVLISMSYQLGLAGVSNFKKMWLALERKDFDLASTEMLDSLWAKQTPKRAKRHSKTMKNGGLDMYYISAGVFQ
jgi:lysozyme